MPVSVASLPASVAYEGERGVVRWEGYSVSDRAAFHSFLAGPVADRIKDVEVSEPLEDEFRALATTGVRTEFLERFLTAIPDEKGWEIGEALAETVLEKDSSRDIIWPWNEHRDRRTPQASLPGADLVGFCRDTHGHALLLGEIKTSADKRVPPHVMNSRSGMTWQLENNATNLGVQHSLLKWLRLRCLKPDLISAYREAVGRFLNSSGKDLILIGVLLRDTSSDENDVRSRACHLANRITDPVRVELLAWYLPIAIADWPAVLGGIS